MVRASLTRRLGRSGHCAALRAFRPSLSAAARAEHEAECHQDAGARTLDAVHALPGRLLAHRAVAGHEYPRRARVGGLDVDTGCRCDCGWCGVAFAARYAISARHI